MNISNEIKNKMEKFLKENEEISQKLTKLENKGKKLKQNNKENEKYEERIQNIKNSIDKALISIEDEDKHNSKVEIILEQIKKSFSDKYDEMFSFMKNMKQTPSFNDSFHRDNNNEKLLGRIISLEREQKFTI